MRKTQQTGGANRLAIDTSDWRFAEEQRFSCLLCHDTGAVKIWTPDTIKRAMRDPDNNVRETRSGSLVDGWETCTVRCTCEKAIGEINPHSQKTVPTLGDRVWHIPVGFTPEEVKRAKIEAATFQPPGALLDARPE